MCEYFDFVFSFVKEYGIFLFIFLGWFSLSMHNEIIKKHGWGVRAHQYYKSVYSYKVFGFPAYIFSLVIMLAWFLGVLSFDYCYVDNVMK